MKNCARISRRALVSVVLAAFLTTGGQASAQPAADKAKGPEPEAPKFAAVIEAEKSGVKACLPLLGDLSRLSIDAPHTAVSTWNKDRPNERMFSAMNFLSYSNATAPRALSIVAATPTPKSHCDGANVRIQPSKLDCSQIAADFKQQKVPDPQAIGDQLLYPPDRFGQRIVLLPAATTGCVVVSTGGYYGK